MCLNKPSTILTADETEDDTAMRVREVFQRMEDCRRNFVEEEISSSLLWLVHSHFLVLLLFEAFPLVLTAVGFFFLGVDGLVTFWLLLTTISFSVNLILLVNWLV